MKKLFMAHLMFLGSLVGVAAVVAASEPTVPQSASDMAIQNAVENDLFWKPFMDLRQLVVRVDEGNVQLEGTVPSALAMEETIRSVEAHGAKSIRNDLKIQTPNS